MEWVYSGTQNTHHIFTYLLSPDPHGDKTHMGTNRPRERPTN